MDRGLEASLRFGVSYRAPVAARRSPSSGEDEHGQATAPGTGRAVVVGTSRRGEGVIIARAFDVGWDVEIM